MLLFLAALTAARASSPEVEAPFLRWTETEIDPSQGSDNPLQQAAFIDRVGYRIGIAEISLDDPALKIEAGLPAGSLANRKRLDDGFPLDSIPLALGTDAFLGDAKGRTEDSAGGPKGPLAMGGRWIAAPSPIFSAVGCAPGNHLIFASTWLKDEPIPWLRMELEAEGGERRPIEYLNRLPEEGEISALTFEFNRERRAPPSEPDAKCFLLSPREALGPLDSESTGARDFTVYGKAEGRQATMTIGERMVALCGRGEAADWLEKHLRQGGTARIGFDLPEEWRGARDAVGLGAPILWNGEMVAADRLRAPADQLWGSLEQPSRPALAYFPAQRRLEAVWSMGRLSPNKPMSRKALASYYIGRGATHLVEFAGEAARSPFFVGGEWIAGKSKSSRSDPTPSALLFRNVGGGKGGKDALVNLARVDVADIRASSAPFRENRAGAVADGSHDEASSLGNFWVGEVKDGPAWIEIELKQTRPVSRIVVYHAQSAGFSSHFNTGAFRLLGSRGSSSRWDVLAEEKDNKERKTAIDLEPPTPLRVVRLEIHTPGRIQSNSDARVAEIEIWGTLPPG